MRKLAILQQGLAKLYEKYEKKPHEAAQQLVNTIYDVVIENCKDNINIKEKYKWIRQFLAELKKRI